MWPFQIIVSVAKKKCIPEDISKIDTLQMECRSNLGICKGLIIKVQGLVNIGIYT